MQDEDLLNPEGSEIWYSGVEPIEVGNLDDIKETRMVVPATRNVRMKITRAENSISKDNTYRSINLGLRLVDGIDEEGKYKNKPMFERVCYYADPNKYTKDFFRTRQHLIPLKMLSRATGVDVSKVDGHTLDALLNAPEIRADITIKKRKVLVDDGSGTQNEVEQLENEVKNFKKISTDDLV